ncbi:MAG TPA: isochorismatase family protein [Candidatus Limnocylindrales bacterium]|nr:isochorismatase family protein [Candidatus Limnocylindrales bacterium]
MTDGARLIDRDDSLLLVVDLQPGFFAGHAEAARAGLGEAVARAAWLVGVAAALGVPVIVTEEDPARNGPTDTAVLARAGPATPVFEKHVFGLAGQPDILAAVEASGRRTTLLTGSETDVCVAQSALGLLARGFRVGVVTDATFSPGAMHALGLRRMREAGVLQVHAKGVYYEWVRTLAEARRFEGAHPDLAAPPGFSL